MVKNIVTSLGQKLRQLRKDKELSLRHVAKEIGVSAAFLSDVELERRHPSDKHMKLLARVLRVSAGELQKYDTRLPMNDLRRIASSNPKYGFAFRQIIKKDISPEELLNLVKGKPSREEKK